MRAAAVKDPLALRRNLAHIPGMSVLPPVTLEAQRIARIRAAAERALGEAAMRNAPAAAHAQEQGGRAGLEPTRYGDWEKRGLAVDF